MGQGEAKWGSQGISSGRATELGGGKEGPGISRRSGREEGRKTKKRKSIAWHGKHAPGGELLQMRPNRLKTRLCASEDASRYGL